MPGLTDEAKASLEGAQDDLKLAFSGISPGSKEHQEVLSASAIVSAIEALCYEVATLRDANYAKLADIEGTLYSRLKG